MNTDRDPADTAPVAAAFDLVQAAVWGEPEANEAAAKALLDALFAQGCLSPEEHEGAFLEDDDDDAGCVSVRVAGLGWLLVFEDGSTDVVAE